MNTWINLVSLFIINCASGICQTISIIPTPQTVVVSDGYFKCLASDVYEVSFSEKVIQDAVADNGLEIVKRALELCHLKSTETTLKAQPSYSLIIRRQGSVHAENITGTYALPAEGYWLKISQDEILARAEDPAGFLYMCQSLEQLFFGSGSIYRSIPAATIIDYPSFSFRGVMDDISRGPLPHLKYMKSQIRRLARYKVNVFSFYIEHVLKTSKHHAFAPKDALTITELIELQDYASKYNIELMGSFQSLGHFRNILRHPEYRLLGVGDRMLKPGDSTALNFLSDVYDEIAPTTAHPIFNINCDEAYDLARGYLKPLATEIGQGSIFQQHILPLLEHVDAIGKTPGMWGDMLLKHPEVIGKLPPETVVFTWNYDAHTDFDALIKPFRKAGLEVVACTGVVNSYRLWPDLYQAHQNIKRFTASAFAHSSLGTMCTVWDDGGRHFFNTDWYGVAYGAALAWNADSNAHSNFDMHYHAIHFQDSSQIFSEILHQLSEVQSIPRLDRLNNYLLEMNYGSAGVAKERIDTTGFAEIKYRLNPLLNSLKEYQFHIENSAIDHDLLEPLIWVFKVEELLLNLTSAETLIQLSNENASASACQKLQEIADQWQVMKTRFIKYWRIENRDYWLAEAFELYDRRTAIFSKIGKQLCNTTVTKSQMKDLKTSSSFIADSHNSIQYWLGAGPFTALHGLDHDYFAQDVGEKNIRPNAIDFFRNQYGKDQGWNKIISNRPGLLDFADFYEPSDSTLPAVAYASSSIEADKARPIRVHLSTGSDTQLFLDNALIHQAPARSEELLEIELKKGRNFFLIKSICEQPCDWSYSFRVLDETMTQNKYKYYLK